ncbi:MAG: hypothetical protein AAFR98_12135 [Pseudomonadota bacterium]
MKTQGQEEDERGNLPEGKKGSSQQSNWVTIVVAAFAGGLFASIASTATGYLDFASKDREIDIRLIEISLGILRGEHEPDGSDHDSVVVARRFAIETIVRLAKTELTDEDIRTWAEGGETPYTEARTSGGSSSGGF